MSVSTSTGIGPSLEAIATLRGRLAAHVLHTPLWWWRTGAIGRLVGSGTEVALKLELFQHTGSFKPRGALANMLDLDGDARRRGVTAITAGNHGIGVAYAARVLGIHAKVVMPRSVSPVRLERARAYGAEVELVDDIRAGWARVAEIEATEGRLFVHPFEGERTVLGTATLGDELVEDAGTLDAVIVPVGGGGLLAGVAAAVKQRLPECAVYGVEPVGADTMSRSWRTGELASIERVATIADSLGAPSTAPYSLAVCRRWADDVVLIDDDAMCGALAVLFTEMKLAVEPAGAAATAALLGPLRERLRGRRVGIIVCGSNIDATTFSQHLQRGASRLALA